MHRLLALCAAVLTAATAPAAQEVAGRFGVRSQQDLGGPFRLRGEQQVQVDLVTPGGPGAFGGIDVVFSDDDDDDDGDDDSTDNSGDDDGPDGDNGDDDRPRSPAAATMSGEAGTPTTFLTDWASRTEVGLDVRLSRAVRAATEFALVLRDGSPLAVGSVGLRTSYPLTDALDLSSSGVYEVQRREGTSEARLRLGAGVERARGRVRPSVGVEVFADADTRRFRRARLDIGSSFRLGGGQRVEAELRLQRRIDRADDWESGLRLGYRIDL